MKQRGVLQFFYLLFVSSFLLFLIVQEFSHENSLTRFQSSSSTARSSFREKSFFFAAASPVVEDEEAEDDDEEEHVQSVQEHEADEEEEVNTLSVQDAENLEQEGAMLEDTASTLFFDTLGDSVKDWFGRIIGWKTSSSSSTPDSTGDIFHQVITPAINIEVKSDVPVPIAPSTSHHGNPSDPWLEKQVQPKDKEDESSVIRSFIYEKDPEWALVPELPRFVHRVIYRLTKMDRKLYFGKDLKFLDGLQDKLERCTNVNDLVKAVSEARKVSKKEAEDLIHHAANSIAKTDVAKRLEEVERKIHMWNQLRKNNPKVAPQRVDMTIVNNETLSLLDPFHGKNPTPDEIIDHLYKEGKLNLNDSAEKIRRVRNLIVHIREAHGLTIQAHKLNRELTDQQKMIVHQAMKGIRKELRKLAGLKKHRKQRVSPEEKAVLRINSLVAVLKEFQLHTTVAKKQTAEKLIDNIFWLKNNFNLLPKEKAFRKKLYASEKMAVSLDAAIHRRWNRVKTHIVFARATIRSLRVWKYLARFLTQMKKLTPGMASVDMMMRQIPKLAEVITATKKSMDKDQKPEFLDLLVQQVSNSVSALKHAAEQESTAQLEHNWTETTKNYELFLIKYRMQLIDWLLQVKDAIVSSCIAPVPPTVPKPPTDGAVSQRPPSASQPHHIQSVKPAVSAKVSAAASNVTAKVSKAASVRPQVSTLASIRPLVSKVASVRPLISRAASVKPLATPKPPAVPTVKLQPVPTAQPAVPSVRPPQPVPTPKPAPPAVPTVQPVPVQSTRPVPVPSVRPTPVPTARPPFNPIDILNVGKNMGVTVLANEPTYTHLVPQKRHQNNSTKMYDFYGVKPLNLKTATFDQLKEHGVLVTAALKKLIKSKFFPKQKKTERDYYASTLPTAAMSVIQCKPSTKKHVIPSEFRDLYKTFKTLRKSHKQNYSKLSGMEKRYAKRFVKFNKMLKETAWGVQISATCKQARKSMKQMQKKLYKVYKGYVSKKHRTEFKKFLRLMRYIGFEQKNGLKYKKHSTKARDNLKKALGRKQKELAKLLYAYSYHAYKAALSNEPVEFQMPPKKVKKGKKKVANASK